MRNDKTIKIEKYGIVINLMIDLKRLNKDPLGDIKYSGGDIKSNFSNKNLDRMILIHATNGIDASSKEYMEGIDYAIKDNADTIINKIIPISEILKIPDN